MKPIPGFDGYFATEEGTIVGRWGRPLAPYRDKDGYLRVTLALARGKDAQRQHRGIHQLVCRTYHGPAPAGHEVRHLDGSKDNNTPDNLRWSTHLENIRDKSVHGTMPRGEGHPMAKLTNEQVRSIRILHAMDFTPNELAPEYGVSRDTIYLITKRKIWR